MDRAQAHRPDRGSSHDTSASQRAGGGALAVGGAAADSSFVPLGLGGQGSAAHLARSGAPALESATDHGAEVDGVGDEEDDAAEGQADEVMAEGASADEAGEAGGEAEGEAADEAGGDAGGGDGGGGDGGAADGEGAEAASAEAEAAESSDLQVDGVGDDEDTDTGAGSDDDGDNDGGALLAAADAVEAEADADGGDAAPAADAAGEAAPAVEAADSGAADAEEDADHDHDDDEDVEQEAGDDLEGDGDGMGDDDDTPAPTSTDVRTIKRAQQYDPHIKAAATRFGVREDHLRAIMAQESRAENGQRAGGAQSASGLMQVTGETWRAIQRAHRDLATYDFTSYWRDPRVNILFGAATLASKQQRLVSAGVGKNDRNMAQLTVAAYNGGEGIVTEAIRRAKAAGSRDPGGDALKPEFLVPAIGKYPSVYRYYLTGGGKRMNPQRSTAKAIALKYQEISKYPAGVAKYLEAQRRMGVGPGGGAGAPASTPAPSGGGRPRPAASGGGGRAGGATPAGGRGAAARSGGLRGSVGRGGRNMSEDVKLVQQLLGLRADGRVSGALLRAIKSFQRGFLNRPDGLIEVGKKSEARLRGGGRTAAPAPTRRRRADGGVLGRLRRALGGGSAPAGGRRPASGGRGGATTGGRATSGGSAAGTMPPQRRGANGKFIVGGRPSSRPAGTKWPMYSGPVVSASIPGLTVRPNVKLTEPVGRTARIVARYLPRGTVLTSAWRTDEEQANLIVRFAGGLIGGDLARTFEVARSRKAIGWVGNSNHRPGLAFDLSGAPLGTIQAAVNKAKREHPDAGVTGTIFESANNCFHVNVEP